MVRIALCDDDIDFLNILEPLILSHMNKYSTEVFVEKFNNGSELLSEFQKNTEKYDVVFMDINLQHESGLEVISKIREFDKSFILIFLSSMENEVFNVFRLNTFRFIRKRNVTSEITSALEDLKKLIVDNSLKYEFKTKDGLLKLSKNEIYYFMYFQRTLQIHTLNNCFNVSNLRFKDVEKEFSSKGFFNINRGILVNLNFVKIIKKDFLLLDNEETLSISKYKINSLKKIFFNKGVDIL